MTCQEFVDFLMAYLDDELAVGQREVFESHMGDCPSCVTYLDTYRDSVRLGKQALRGTGSDPIPEDVPEDLVQAILAARKR